MSAEGVFTEVCMHRWGLIGCALVLCECVCLGGNWPQWRGPSLNGVAVETNLPVRWTATENVTWKLAMSDFSGSTPIIWNDRIFLDVADGTVYVTSEDGVTTVIEAGPAFNVLAENDLAEYTLSSPAVSDGQIFLRTQRFLYSLGKRTAPAK
jgi:outer membrane protein assembly factor BamB